MKGRRYRLAVVAAAALCTAPPLAAEKPKDDGVERIETALRVAEWARTNGDAQGLIVAAALLASVETRKADDRGRIEPEEKRAKPAAPAAGIAGRVQPAPAPPPPEFTPPSPPAADDVVVTAQRKTETARATRRPLPTMTPGALLDEAEALSEGDPSILAIITAQRQQAAKGVAFSNYGTGPVRVSREIPARATWRIALTVRGGEPLHVIAIGDGDTEVDIEIRDSSGRIVCNDRSPGHYASCSLTPPFPGQYTARIINHGMIKTLTTLVSN